MKHRPYPKYKPSGVEWLGDVPEHWSVKAIKWESPVLRGASPRPIDDPIYFDDEDGEYSWVRISDVTSAGMYLGVTEQKLSLLGSSLSVKLEPGSLFLSIAGSVGKPCITQIKCCIHDGFVYFPRFKGEAKFMYYLFACGEPYRGLGKLGTQLNLNTDTVGSIVAGFPDTSEQRAIAAFLDRETGRIDRLVAKKRELIERLKEKRTALISAVVTGKAGIVKSEERKVKNPDGSESVTTHFTLHPALKTKPSRLDWIGDMPEHWEIVPLGYLVQLSGGATPDKSKPEYWDGPIPWVSPKDMKVSHIEDSEDHVSPAAVDNSALRLIPVGAVLIVVRGMILAHSFPVALTCTSLTINQDMKALISGKRVGPCFLSWSLAGYAKIFVSLADESAHGTRKLETTTLTRFPFLLPPLSEQAAIAAYLDTETVKLDVLSAKVEQAIERLQEYRSALITAAVTGKINVGEACAS